MTLGATNGVKAPAWRSQPRQGAEPIREAEPAPSHFDSLLASSRATEVSRRREAAETRKSETTPAESAERRDKGAHEATRTRSTAKDDSASRARSTDAADSPGRDRPAKADDAQPETTGKTATTTSTPSGPSSDETALPGEVPGQAAAPTVAGQPIILPIPANAAPPAPPPNGQAGAGGEAATQGTAAVTAAANAAKMSAKIAGLPGAVIDAEDTGDSPSEPGKGAGGFLAALPDAVQSAATPDPATSAVSSPGLTAAPPPSNAATHLAPPTTPAMPATPPVPLGQVPMTIGLRSLAGSSEFQIRLDPADLGRIDVTLEIDKRNGTVATHLVVDRPDTLAMLQRDAGQLQQALTQAGLDPSASGINLSLRGDGGQSAGGQADRQQGGTGQPNGPWTAEPRADSETQTGPMQTLRGYGGLDIRI